MSSYPVPADASAGAPGRKRIPTACEACRVAKIRCLPSDEAGVCQKCLVSKKECVSRTGPRRRRPNRSKLLLGDHQLLPPPPPPSGTFTIDIPIVRPSEGFPSADTLRDTHAACLDSLFPSGSADPSSASSPFSWRGGGSIDSSNESTATTTTLSLPDDNARPSFNMASAESLLGMFRSMLRFCPCVRLADDVTVPELAATRPFVLLAILAAAAGARSLRGHNLYDDEFRRVFALKLVAGGERSLELLQGILIYCLWYPFHLRPRVKQVFQYTRMAGDLVHDLELDVATAVDYEPITPDYLDSVRAYVAQHYLSSSFSLTWQSYRSRIKPTPFTAWTERCCLLLEQHAECPGDAVLTSLTRLGRTVLDAGAAARSARLGGDGNNSSLVFRGLEAQFQDQQATLSPAACQPLAIRLQTLFTEFFLVGVTLIRLPDTNVPASASSFRPSLVRLQSCVSALSRFLALLATVPAASLAHFSTGDWGRVVLGVVIAMRLSFPLPECCPGYDSGWARERLGFAAFLDAMTAEEEEEEQETTVVATAAEAAAAKRSDIVSACKMVLGVVKEKYKKRLAWLRQQEGEEEMVVMPRPKCPMMDISLQNYLPLWEGGGDRLTASGGLTASMPPPMSFMQGAAGEGDGMLDVWAADMFDWIEPRDDGLQ